MLEQDFLLFPTTSANLLPQTLLSATKCHAGTGTFGRVRLVRSRSTGTYLALKAVKKAKVLERKQVAHIVNEKAVLSQVHHPFIISL